MINKILNWIKNIFKTEKQDPHLILYEDMPESDMPIHVEETAKQKKIREKHKGDK